MVGSFLRASIVALTLAAFGVSQLPSPASCAISSGSLSTCSMPCCGAAKTKMPLNCPHLKTAHRDALASPRDFSISLVQVFHAILFCVLSATVENTSWHAAETFTPLSSLFWKSSPGRSPPSDCLTLSA
jgi:hypothetical protein